MNHILLTGAAGFIGSNLCEKLLQSGYSVTGIDNFDDFYDRKIKESNLRVSLNYPHFTFIEGDIRNAKDLPGESVKIDIVVHLAAKAGVLPSIQKPQEYISNNIDGTFTLLEWMRQRGINKLVFASSSSVYGNNKKIPFMEADNVDNPISPYAFTKKSCELMAFTYHHLYKMDILNLRFFTVYGPRQRPDLAIHKFVKLILAGQPVQMYGNGDSARDYTFVDDTVAGVIAAIEYVLANKNVYEIINIGNNSPITLRELVTKIYEVLGVKENIVVLPAQPGDVDVTYSSIDKAKELLGYNPSTKIDSGLEKFISWYRRNHS